MTKILMTASALAMGLIGVLFTFLPEEINTYVQLDSNTLSIILFQLMGALYLGFAMLNWMAKSSIIGGIYNRPLVIGNFMHFAVGALALIKVTIDGSVGTILIAVTSAYALFAVAFGYVFMVNPSSINKRR